MQDDFQPSLKFVLAWEGGFSDNPVDPGGATNFGIIQTEYDAWRQAQGLPTRTVQLITMDEVDTIYQNSYWNALHGDYVLMPLCQVLFDTGVNMGVGRACQFLNQAFNLGNDVMEWTQGTSEHYHSLTPAQIASDAQQILGLRRAFYQQIVADNPSQQEFLQGWLNRVNALTGSVGLALA